MRLARKAEPGIRISISVVFSAYINELENDLYSRYHAIGKKDDISTQSNFLNKTNSRALEFTLCINFLIKLRCFGLSRLSISLPL